MTQKAGRLSPVGLHVTTLERSGAAGEAVYFAIESMTRSFFTETTPFTPLASVSA